MIVLILYIIFSLFITGCGIYFTYTYKLIPGPRGNKGPKGDRGINGAYGTKGPQGYKGPNGGKGPPGIPGGIRGPIGDKGSIGPKGPKGLRGFRGFRGDKGDSGERGLIGEMGRPGIPGPDGEVGDPGEYMYSEIDYDTCRIYPFDKFREMKCGPSEVLIEINNDINNYFGKCCKLKLSERCVNKESSTVFDKKLTKEEKARKDKYYKRFPATKALYFKYDCDEGHYGEPQGNVYRCCKKQIDSYKYDKNY